MIAVAWIDREIRRELPTSELGYSTFDELASRLLEHAGSDTPRHSPAETN